MRCLSWTSIFFEMIRSLQVYCGTMCSARPRNSGREHSRDADHPQRQKPERPADPVSGAYRLNEFLPLEKVTMLPEGTWREVQLVFRGESAFITVDKTTWHQELKRPGFNAAKRKLLWMQNGGEQGIELDDIRVAPTSDAP